MSIRIIICKGVHLLGGCLGPDTLGYSRLDEPLRGVVACTLLHCRSTCILNFLQANLLICPGSLLV